MKKMIPFNKPYLSGAELTYISQTLLSGKISGDGFFTKKCHDYFENKYGFKKVLLTTSCTDALEMAAILLNIQPSDEVIAPSYTFVSTVNAFALRGAKIIFADSYPHHPNIDPDSIERQITEKTKAIVVVHYAGVACDMDRIMSISEKYNIPVVEDAAQAIDSYYKGRALGSIGTFGTLSFHETKNIISGEGGLLIINDEQYFARAEIIREKGTNRSSFFRGEVDKYGWVDIGSSFLPSDILAAFLYGQLENIDDIQAKRKSIWLKYYEGLKSLADKGYIKVPEPQKGEMGNAHMFYIICQSLSQRTELIDKLKLAGVHATFHYLSLHTSQYYKDTYDGLALENSDMFTDCLVRLPLFYGLNDTDIDYINKVIWEFVYKNDLLTS